MNTKRAVAATVASFALMVGYAGVAQAKGSDSGYKSCAGSGSTVATRGVASGKQTHFHNSRSVSFPSSGSTVTVRYYNAGLTTANWKVATDGAIDASDTYAYCPG